MFYAWSGHFGPFNKLRDEMNRLFDTAFLGRGFIPNLFERRTFPRLNMRETENALVVECELPGVARDDLGIAIENDVLTIRGERKTPEGRTADDYVRRERSFGPFERRLELPARVDVDAVKAAYANGLLEITLPKHPEAKPRKIDVSVG
jgi:HSP20 family protein